MSSFTTRFECLDAMNAVSITLRPSMRNAYTRTRVLKHDIAFIYLFHNQGSLRLTDGVQSGSGRLEIYHDGEWGSICDDSFDITDAHVACRQIGYAKAVGILSSSDDYTKGKCYDSDLEN